MKKEDIVSVTLNNKGSERETTHMLAGEISGATVFHHTMLKGDEVQFIKDTSFVRVLFLCEGNITLALEGKDYIYKERAVFVPYPEQTLDLKIEENTNLLEIRWEMHKSDWEELQKNREHFPITSKYVDAKKYRDSMKSEKTISRAIIPQRIIPRFAMGSVETYGEDLIRQHEHPLLDQFFFSLPENDMTLLIDDLRYQMKGNSLLHIPLGSNHGVEVTKNQCAHYIWIDFIFNEEGLAYLDEEHKETSTICSTEE